MNRTENINCITELLNNLPDYQVEYVRHLLEQLYGKEDAQKVVLY